jgi:chromosome segregation ATPase
MSEVLIASLQKRIDELTQEKAVLASEAKSRRLKAKAIAEENETLKSTVGALTTERDALKSRAEAAPHELQAQVDEYKGKLRDRDHRDKFKALAHAAGVTQDKALDDLWQLSGYKAEADEVDDAKITAAITGALAGRDWLKAAPAPVGANGKPAAPATTTAQVAAHDTRSPGPGASRGGASTTPDFDAVLAAKYPAAGRLA